MSRAPRSLLNDLSLHTARLQQAAFPWWVVKKEGTPLLLEADWPLSSFEAKWGSLITGTGGGARLDRSTRRFYGGKGSCLCRTNAAVNAVTEVKVTMPFITNGIVALEHKWIPSGAFGANKWEFGIESRTENIVQARMRYTVSTDEWQYENPDQNDTYLSFPTPVVIRQPLFQAPGDEWGWARLVVDLTKREYVRFQAAGQQAEFWDIDMRGIRMRDRADAAGTKSLLFFGLGVAGAASNEDFYTTDWAISQL
jgi:hypothetical protein